MVALAVGRVGVVELANGLEPVTDLTWCLPVCEVHHPCEVVKSQEQVLGAKKASTH